MWVRNRARAVFRGGGMCGFVLKGVFLRADHTDASFRGGDRFRIPRGDLQSESGTSRNMTSGLARSFFVQPKHARNKFRGLAAAFQARNVKR